MADKNLEDLYKSIYEKKANKDYDGDGKVESGSKEHAGAVHNAIQRKRGLKPDGQDTRKEEVELDERYKGKHGQSEKEYADSRSSGGKMVSGDSKQSGAEYTHGRRVKAANPGMQPDVGGKTKPKSQGKMDRGTRADLQYRKANLKKEELENTGLFLDWEIDAILEVFNEGVRDEDPEKGTAERKARLEKKRGMKLDDHPQYKKEEVELDENRAAARAAGGYKDDSKKQTDPSKAGFTGIGNMSIDQIRKMSARIEKEKTKKEEFAIDEGLSGERYKKVMNKPGGTAYSRKVSADPSKRATRGGRGGESDFGAGDRGSGNRARRRAKSEYKNKFEEVEVVDEKMDLAKADMGDVVKDFYKSDAPQFSGASKEKRRKMAVAAVLTARRGGRKLGEEKEGCDCCGKTPCECDNREMPTKASLLKNKMRARGIKVAGETPSTRNMKTYDEIDEQMTTQTQFKPLPSSGSTGVNRPPAAPTLPPPSASKPKEKPQTKQYSGYSITGNTIQMNSFEAEGEQLQEKPGDGYLGNTPIPNPIRLAKDAVDATNRASQKKVNAVNSVLPGSASMPKHTYFNKGPSAASQRYLGLKNSFEPEGEMTEEASDRARDKRQERGGVGANVDYSRPPAKKATNKELGIRDFTPEEKEKRRKEMIAHLKKMRKS